MGHQQSQHALSTMDEAKWKFFHGLIRGLVRMVYRRQTRDLWRDSDVEQEALLAALKCPEKVQDGSPEEIERWAVKLVEWSVSKMRRRQRQAKRDCTRDCPLDAAAEVADEQLTPFDEAEHNELVEKLRDRLESLPESGRLGFYLYYWEKYSVAGIASEWGWTRDAVQGLLERGRAELRAGMGLDDWP